MSTVCFTETACYYNLNYHRTQFQYITQNKLLIQKVPSLTGQIISLERSTETNIELLLSCQETGNSKRIPQIIPIQVTQAVVLLSRPREGEQQRDLGEASHAELGNSCSQLWGAALRTAAETQQGSQRRVCVRACAFPHNALQLPDYRKRSSGRRNTKLASDVFLTFPNCDAMKQTNG